MYLNHYNNLCILNNLFLKKKYKSKISSKASEDSIAQNLIYYKKDNITEQYSINIINSNNIKITIPLKNCNSPKMYFMYENNVLNFEHGRAYFLNTNKSHSLFSYRDSYMLVLNVDSNEETFKIIGDNMMIS